jgi:GTP-binding protein Era
MSLGHASGFRSGFVSLVGRPNVGKSTLLNRILGEKVSIIARTPNTTRTRVRGVLNGADYQIVFVDTPGMHKPRTALGERLNEAAESTFGEVDVTVLVVDGAGGVGSGDRFVADRLGSGVVVAVNKIDAAGANRTIAELQAASTRLGLAEGTEFFPISARTGKGVPEFVEHLVGRLAPGPRYYPEGVVRDVADPVYVAELVREQLLRTAREELPHSIACQVTEWEWPYIEVEILVERDSQKAIVIGTGGEVLKAVGTTVRQALPHGAYLDLKVRVERDWQRRPDIITRLGY